MNNLLKNRYIDNADDTGCEIPFARLSVEHTSIDMHGRLIPYTDAWEYFSAEIKKWISELESNRSSFSFNMQLYYIADDTISNLKSLLLELSKSPAISSFNWFDDEETYGGPSSYTKEIGSLSDKIQTHPNPLFSEKAYQNWKSIEKIGRENRSWVEEVFVKV